MLPQTAGDVAIFVTVALMVLAGAFCGLAILSKYFAGLLAIAFLFILIYRRGSRMIANALLLLAGKASADLASRLTNAVAMTPSPLLAVDYGVYRLVERFGGIMEQAAGRLETQGEADMAAELREQLDTFRSQAQFFDRLRVSVYADEQGLVMDQVMELR